MNEKLKQGAVLGMLFECSDNGWIDQVLYTQWLKFLSKKLHQPDLFYLLKIGIHLTHHLM